MKFTVAVLIASSSAATLESLSQLTAREGSMAQMGMCCLEKVKGQAPRNPRGWGCQQLGEYMGPQGCLGRMGAHKCEIGGDGYARGCEEEEPDKQCIIKMSNFGDALVLGEAGSNGCTGGLKPVPQNKCLAAAKEMAGDNMGSRQSLLVGDGSKSSINSWGGIPHGCNVQSEGACIPVSRIMGHDRSDASLWVDRCSSLAGTSKCASGTEWPNGSGNRCQVKKAGDWAAHYNSGSSNWGNNGMYQPVCVDQGAIDAQKAKCAASSQSNCESDPNCQLW